MSKGTKTLRTFIKKECANYYENGCVYDHPCLVFEGKRCKYFEKSVLGPADYKFRLPGYDYQKIFRQYAVFHNHLYGVEVELRKCECGEILKPRQRRCEKCSKKRARTTNRERQKKHRAQRNASTENNTHKSFNNKG